MVKTYLKTGLGLIGSGVVVGSIPNITGTITESNLKTNFSTGLGKVGNVLPFYGKVLGTKMVLKQTKKLKSPYSKLMKGGRRLYGNAL